jgi:tetratricopeptide (TPR) repeat protein
VEAVQLLKAFALVTTDVSGDSMSVSMHPLVHAWARDRQSVDEQHENWLSMVCTVALAPKCRTMTRAYDRQLQPYVESVTAWDMGTMFAGAPRTLVARVLVNCGWLLNQIRSDSQLSLLIQRLNSWLGLDEMAVEAPWLGIYDLASRNLVNRGLPRQAIHLLQQVVEVRKESLGPDRREYPDQLASQHALAGAYEANRQVKEAVALLKEVVQIRSQSLAADHPDRLASQLNFAVCLWEVEERERAYHLMSQVVDHYKQKFDDDHPARLTSEQCLYHFREEIEFSG